MNKKRIITGRFITILLLTALTLLSCKEGSSGSGLKWDESPEKYVYTDESTPYGVLIVDNAEKEYDLFAEVQSDAKDLYVGVYNSSAAAMSNPEVEVSEFDSRKYLTAQSSSSQMERIQDDNYRLASKIINSEKSWNRSEALSGVSPYSGEIVDTTEFSFADEDDSGADLNYNSTLRESRTFTTGSGEKALKVWVENECWHEYSGSGKEEYPITDDMVTYIANAFLQDGDFNDIYDWVTNIYGEEWGVHNYTDDLIDDYDEINIVLADLMHDNLESGIAGYFWAKDNYQKTADTGYVTDISNERIIFYIEANYLAYAEPGETWDSQGYYAKDTISTLAHEFQHMINFYQATVVRNIQPDTWLNELLSMATEDILSDKMGVAGPKGFTTTDGKAPASGSAVTDGRVPYYNQYPDVPYNSWLTGDYVLLSYSLMYTYGAYLTRNFGGPEVLQQLMYNASGASDLPAALNFGSNDTTKTGMTIPLTNAAVMLSDRTDTEDYMRFNRDGWFEYTFNGHSYRLSSLNFFSYTPTPYVYTTSQEEKIKSIPAGSFYFTEYVTDMTGRYHIGLSSDYPDADVVEVLLK